MGVKDYLSKQFLATLLESPAWQEFLDAMLDTLDSIDVKIEPTYKSVKRSFDLDPRLIEEVDGLNLLRLDVDGTIIVEGDGITFSNDGTNFYSKLQIGDEVYVDADLEAPYKVVNVVDFKAVAKSFESVIEIFKLADLSETDDATFFTDMSIMSPFLLKSMLNKHNLEADIKYTFLDEFDNEVEGVYEFTVREGITLEQDGNLLKYKTQLTLRPLLDYIEIGGSFYQILAFSNENIALTGLQTSGSIISGGTWSYLITGEGSYIQTLGNTGLNVITTGKYNVYRSAYFVPVSELKLKALLELDILNEGDETSCNLILTRATPLRCFAGSQAVSNISEIDELEIFDEGLYSEVLGEDSCSFTEEILIPTKGDFNADFNNDFWVETQSGIIGDFNNDFSYDFKR